MARLPPAGKTVAVALAVLLAAAATTTIFLYVRGVEERAFEDAERVEVFVAEGPIEAGTSAAEAIGAGLIGRDAAPRANVPDGAITALDQIDGLVTLERTLPGEIVLRGRWGSSEDASVGFEIPAGFEAVAVEVGIPPGVAGHIRPEDRVSLIANVETPGGTTTDADGNVTEQPGEVRTQYLLQGVEVLAVGPRTTETEQAPAQQASLLVTFALEPVDAERLVFATQNASLYVTLLPEDAPAPETPGRTFEDLFN